VQDPIFQRFTIIGAGLMGTSLALALRERGAVGGVVLHDRSGEVLEAAAARDAADAYEASLEEAVAAADVICLAIPVGRVGELVETLSAYLSKKTVLTDLGSVKAVMRPDRLPALPAGVALVPAHPVAGGELAGPQNARGDLFRGTRVVLTPEPEAERAAVEQVAALWRAVGAETREMSPQAHDVALAWMSHLPQAAASILMGAVGLHARENESLYELAGAGLADSTRLAASAPDVWADILLENRAAVGDALDTLLQRLMALAAAVEHGERTAIYELIAEGQAARRRFEAAQSGDGSVESGA